MFLCLLASFDRTAPEWFHTHAHAGHTECGCRAPLHRRGHWDHLLAAPVPQRGRRDAWWGESERFAPVGFFRPEQPSQRSGHHLQIGFEQQPSLPISQTTADEWRGMRDGQRPNVYSPSIGAGQMGKRQRGTPSQQCVGPFIIIPAGVAGRGAATNHDVTAAPSPRWPCDGTGAHHAAIHN